jgi:hypothetical protein
MCYTRDSASVPRPTVYRFDMDRTIVTSYGPTVYRSGDAPYCTYVLRLRPLSLTAMGDRVVESPDNL